ncbi:MAG: hypothetical protein Kow0037_18330 [Calditrichia bacterium]
MSNRIVLTLIDTMQIQRYIFSSNRLREMVGASALLKKVTEDWLIEILYEQFGIPVPADDTLEVLKEQNPIEGNTDTPFEIIYCGGGNAKILFKGNSEEEALKKAKGVIKPWSRKVLDKAPGLQVAVLHLPVKDEDQKEFNKFIEAAEAELARKKANFAANLAELSPPFVVRCPSTGLPASKHDEKNQLSIRDKNNQRISEQAYVKRKAADDSFKRWLEKNGKWLLFLNKEKAAFPQNLDELGQKEGNNFIGIIHADGNFMGKKVMAIANKHARMRDYIDKIREFSIKLEESNRQAFTNVLSWVDENYSEWTKTLLKLSEIEDGKYKGLKAFPIRPIILGGDDFTAVTAGPIALQVAKKFMEEFKKACDTWCGGFELEQITASGGVALVHSHMPFDKAYEMAESLAASAKKKERKKQEKEADRKEASWLDWHIATDNHLDEIGDLRAEKYTRKINGKTILLTCKPYRLDEKETNEPFWDSLVNSVRLFQDKEKFPRNKLKSLLNIAGEGPEAARDALREMKYHLKVNQFENLEKELRAHHKAEEAELFFEKSDANGETKYCTAIFDIVESLEFIVPEKANGGK